MTPLPIHIDARHEVPHYSNEGITDIISIGSLGEKPPFIGHFNPRPHIHRFQFDDIWEGSPASRFADDGEWPTEEVISRMIETFRVIQGRPARVLFHCTAGISRSTAAAFIYLVTAGWDYESAINEVYRVRNCCHPNVLIVKHADNILKHEGKMLGFMAAALGMSDYPAKWGSTFDLIRAKT